MEAQQVTILGQCIGNHKSGDYCNLAIKTVSGDYLILSVPPQWRGIIPNVGDFGVYSYMVTVAYTTTYQVNQDEKAHHKYTALYFKAFLPTLRPEEIQTTGSFTSF